MKWLRFPPQVHGDIRNWERGEIQGRGQALNSRQDKNDVLAKPRWLEMWVWDWWGAGTGDADFKVVIWCARG